MVKDAGLACKFVISKKPEGAPVTERAIPLAIFQSETSVKKHYLKKWLKSSTITDFDIRNILDWEYYIERFASCVQKIITIPAALQGLNNPVPRVSHPDWLHKKLLEKNDVFKQKRINELFEVAPKSRVLQDIEDLQQRSATIQKRRRSSEKEDLSLNWKQALGPPPAWGPTKEERIRWVEFQKKKWAYQLRQKQYKAKRSRKDKDYILPPSKPSNANLGSFLRWQANTLLYQPWQVIQIAETGQPGMY